MKAIKISFSIIFIILTLVWFMADTLLPDPLTYFSFRHVFVQFSGVIAMGAMCIAMVLAVRPRWLENHLDGLDKMYRLHKWLGITALIASTAHWWFGKGTKWMVGWGWLERPQRAPRGEEQLGMIEELFRNQRGLAETIGEWTFYAAAILLIIALVKMVPYRFFAKTHKIMAAAFLLLAWHSLVLLEYPYWAQPVGWLMAALLLAGSVAALMVLFGMVGRQRKVRGTVECFHWYPELQVMETAIKLDAEDQSGGNRTGMRGWQGHKPGQFAFVTSSKKEGAHPYTIASAWHDDSEHITFITKALGDHTSRLPEILHEGMEVQVEGPYGCFTFDDNCRQQIWVGAGIGITPFIARMKHLAKESDGRTIHLFHPTGQYEQAAIDKLTADAQAAGITLHVLASKDGRRLSADIIRAEVPDWEESSIWFCGPAAFGTTLRDDIINKGLPAQHFHQELFEMR